MLESEINMCESPILDLNQFCYFALFKQIRLNCEKTNEKAALDDFKYMDLQNFLNSYPPFHHLFYEWDRELNKRLFLLNVSSQKDICIDFAELYERLKGLPEKVKKAYWKSLNLAIEENDVLTSVELKYSPKTYHREHMDVFESVMKQLRAKKGLKKLKVHIAGYTLEGLNGFDSLEELVLDVIVDIEELTECCRKNQGIRFLSVSDLQSGGRLADIVPFCCQVRKFAFKLKFDCDASEYASLAKLPQLEELRICGEHERGTLQALFGGLARREPRMLLSTLSVDDASLVSAETEELARIESLTKLRYRCAGPQAIGPLAQLTNLKSLDILSHHDFKLIGDQIFRLLKYSQRRRKVFLPECWITYNPREDALLLLLSQDHDASDYGSLLRLPNLNCLEIHGHQKPGTFVGLFDELAQVKVSTLTTNDRMTVFALSDLAKRNGRVSYPDYTLFNAKEIVALSRCKSLTKLLCGVSDTRNIELLAELSQLRDLTITTKPANCSLLRLFEDIAASNSPCLRDFTLSHGRINIREASALAKIGSLRSLHFDFYDATDIDLFSSLGWANSFTLRICSNITLNEISDVTLRVSQFCGKFVKISTSDVTMAFHRQQKHLQLTMYPTEIYSSRSMLPSLVNLYWVESLDIYGKPFNLSVYFKAISTSGNCQLRKILIRGSVDPNETEELSKIKSLKEFHGKLTNTQSLEHLCHLSYLNILNSFKNQLPERIVPILDSIEKELTISLVGKEVSYNIKTGYLLLSCTGFPNSSNDATDFAPLATLKSLKSVRICGSYMGSSLYLFLSQLASRHCQTLQELVVESEQDSELFITSSQLEAIASIKSLQKLKCGFLEAQNLELIADLPHLTELVITTHQEGSLKDLLQRINTMESPRLEFLAVEGERLTTEEELQVAAMRSLKRLECRYSSTVVLDYQGQSSCIGKMTVRKDRHDISLVELFKNSPFLTSLIVLGAPINREEADEIRKIKPLQRLIYRFEKDTSVISDLLRLSSELETLVITSREHSLAHFEDTTTGDTIARLPQDIKQDLLSFDDFEGVVQYLDRQRLVIELPPEINCLKFLFEALALNKSQSLQQLVIRHRYIGLEEAASIGQISCLKRLMCGVQDPSGLLHLCNLKRLERLEIRSLENFDELSHHLICLLQECKALESIDLDFSFPIQFIKGDFLLRALSTLASVRNPRAQTPLKLRFPPNKRIFKDPMSPINEEYLKVEGAR